HRDAWLVAKSHVSQLDRGREIISQRHCVWPIGQLGWDVEHFENSVPGSHSTLQNSVLERQRTNGIEKSLHIKDESDHDADSQMARHHGSATDDDDNRLRN